MHNLVTIILLQMLY